ncbi:glycoside hydrolase family 18 protein [Jaapia argillacea MUCL 33604]|uniref:Glycoside hydrolase family 18 protein n=1 Tax=Jaapia argillacea MUCL 33604 TaxID=933084 RepID=A0A067PK05_9AGAM|nr:glycoside hydrolase family 18 protein [Jaapia argillacea MUCL 33604]
MFCAFITFAACAPTFNSNEVGPRFATYTDRWVPGQSGPPPVDEVRNYNTIILSFLLLSGPADQALSWTLLPPPTRAEIKSQYASAGKKLLVSAFGSTDIPTTEGADPIKTADWMGEWVKKWDLDGIDVDYEDFGAMNAGDGKAEAWLISFTKQLRVHLPQGQYIITHAPVAPWFSPSRWGGGGYLAVDSAIGNMVDWYNVQFYNQGIAAYITCPNLLTNSPPPWPKTSLFEIASSGIPLNKIIIGKPAIVGMDATNGWLDPVMLSFCLRQAKVMGWSGGLMLWQAPEANDLMMAVVRSESWPV